MKIYLLDVIGDSQLSKQLYDIHSFYIFAHSYDDAKRRALDVVPENDIVNIYELTKDDAYHILYNMISNGDL